MARYARDEDALFAFGHKLQMRGQFRQAAKLYGQVLSLNPENTGCLNNLGNCLRSLGRDADAIPFFHRALAIHPGKRSARLNLGMARLALGQYEAAWPNYEARLEIVDYRKEAWTSGKPRWNGQPLERGERLFVYGNQGLGDELQCLRYLPWVSRLAPNHVIEVQAPLFPLVKGMPGIGEVMVRPEDRALPAFDHHVEFFSLPEIFGTTANRIPPVVAPPVSGRSEVVSFLRRDQIAHPGGKRIGLVWSGNPENEINRFRACGLVHLQKLLDVSNCRFFSLQKGIPRRELEERAGDRLIDLAPMLNDMRETAMALRELDLLITPDTSVPHLAGTIGTPAWVLLHEPADWRWGRRGERTPWYPKLRLFRQEKPGHWMPVVERVKSELERFAESPGGRPALSPTG